MSRKQLHIEIANCLVQDWAIRFAGVSAVEQVYSTIRCKQAPQEIAFFFWMTPSNGLSGWF
jgi:hypothetical protein